MLSSPPSWISCSIAAGRCRSAATSAGFFPSSRRSRASFAAAVVLPAPWRPARRIVVGGFCANARRESVDPSSSVSSSCTIFTTCCPGVRLLRTSSPSARSRTCATKSLTTSRLTSASSRASRTSRIAREIDSSSRTPRPRRSPSALWSLSERASNIARQGTRLEIRRVERHTCPMVSTIAARKTVSILFCDLADSTALGERLDPEPLRGLMGSWYEAMRAAIERHGGTGEKFVGDAVMAVFGLPQAHEDDALRAVRAALEMQSAVQHLNASLAEREIPELRIRIGINTGEVVTGGGTATLVTGDAVNTAKRLEQAAAGGEILIGAVTERLVRHVARLEAIAPVDAKGKTNPVEAWRVLLLETEEEAAPYPEPRFVGRGRELKLLEETWERVRADNRCELVTILGEAGIGKSRLVSEISARIEGQIVTGRCLSYGEGITYGPVL